MDLQAKVKEIKQSFRQMMDGATAQSMRQKGADYRLNWGTTLPHLREMASDIIHSVNTSHQTDNTCRDATCRAHHPSSATLASLAIALWKEDVRECKILATMIMPPEQMLPEIADIWMQQTTQLEIVEQQAFNLYQHVPFAAQKAFEWIASDKELPQICGYHILSRLFMKGQEPNERGINEFIDQAIAALQSNSVTLRKAAMQCMVHFSQLGLIYQRIARSATQRCGLDII